MVTTKFQDIFFSPTCGGRKSSKTRLAALATLPSQVGVCSTCARRKSEKYEKFIFVHQAEKCQLGKFIKNRLATAASRIFGKSGKTDSRPPALCPAPPPTPLSHTERNTDGNRRGATEDSRTAENSRPESIGRYCHPGVCLLSVFGVCVC